MPTAQLIICIRLGRIKLVLRTYAVPLYPTTDEKDGDERTGRMLSGCDTKGEDVWQDYPSVTSADGPGRFWKGSNGGRIGDSLRGIWDNVIFGGFRTRHEYTEEAVLTVSVKEKNFF